MGILGSLIEFGEEIFPFTDIFPTFTVAKISVILINKIKKKNA